MNKKIKIGLGVVVAVVAVSAATHIYFGDRARFTTEPEFTGLERTEIGNDLISGHDPDAILRVDPEFRFLGGQKFILYGVADTEQYFFVKTSADDALEAVYWVQYEAYLPGKNYTYDYDDSPLRVQLGDYEFYTDTEVFKYDPTRQRKQGTDGSSARQFLASKGYQFPTESGYARLVYLTDESRQKELMIIYIEDLALRGYTASDFGAEGARVEQWPDVEQAMIESIQSTIGLLEPLERID